MRFIVFQNKKIFYRVEGSGKPVMLLHGFAENNNIWNHQTENLKKDFLIIVPDLPGSGDSEMPDKKLTIEDYADVIKAIADVEITKEAGNTFTLVGHSMGGYITLAFAEKYPDLLNAFGLFHSSAFADDEAKKETRQKGIEFIKNNSAATFLKNTSANLFSPKTKETQPWLIDNLINFSTNFAGKVLIKYYEAMIERPDRISVLRNFPHPILFIIGKDDNAVPLQTSLQQCHIPACAHIHILENSGHMGMWEEDEKSTVYLREFLR